MCSSPRQEWFTWCQPEIYMAVCMTWYSTLSGTTENSMYHSSLTGKAGIVNAHKEHPQGNRINRCRSNWCILYG